MVRLSIQETPGGAWRVDVHPSDKFNLDQDYTFERKRDALQRPRTSSKSGFWRWTTADRPRPAVLTIPDKRHMLTKGESL